MKLPFMLDDRAFNARKWARGFALLFFAGLLYSLMRDYGDSRLPGQIMMAIGMIGWLAAKIRLWFFTNYLR